MEQNQPQSKNSLDYSNWTQHYAMLSESSREDPMGAIMNISTITSLFNVRQELWSITVDLMYFDSTKDSGSDTMGDRMFFFKTMHEMFELAYRVRELAKDKKLVYQYLFD